MNDRFHPARKLSEEDLFKSSLILSKFRLKKLEAIIRNTQGNTRRYEAIITVKAASVSAMFMPLFLLAGQKNNCESSSSTLNVGGAFDMDNDWVHPYIGKD